MKKLLCTIVLSLTFLFTGCLSNLNTAMEAGIAALEVVVEADENKKPDKPWGIGKHNLDPDIIMTEWESETIGEGMFEFRIGTFFISIVEYKNPDPKANPEWVRIGFDFATGNILAILWYDEDMLFAWEVDLEGSWIQTLPDPDEQPKGG